MCNEVERGEEEADVAPFKLLSIHLTGQSKTMESAGR
jgi:hypothetical protein